MQEIDRDFKVKKWDPKIILHSLKNVLIAILGVGTTNVTLNDKAISNVKTTRLVIGGVGVSGCDANFATANGIAEQIIDLGAVIPAFARILDARTVTLTAFAHASTKIASWAVATNVVTITTQTAHGLVTGNSVVIAGMTETALNGTYTITRTSDTAFTYSKTHGDAGTTADITGTSTFAALALVAETGTSSSGAELIASATIKAVNAVTAVIHTFNLNIAPTAAAKNIFVSATPDGKWDHITAGQVAVCISYISI